MTTLDEVKLLIQEQTRVAELRHTDSVASRTRMEGTLQSLAGEVLDLRGRVDRSESKTAEVEKLARKAFNSYTDLESRSTVQFGQVASSLSAQDKEIDAIKTETKSQTGDIGEIKQFIAALKGQGRMLLWLVGAAPVVIGGVIALIHYVK